MTAPQHSPACRTSAELVLSTTQELLCRERPLRGHLRAPRVPEECPPSVKALVDDCIEAKSPALRPSAYEVFVRLATRRAAMPTCLREAWSLVHGRHGVL